MGVDQTNYSTYIKVVQLYISAMQTAVSPQQLYQYLQLFKIWMLQLFTYLRLLLSPRIPVSQENLAAGASLQELQCLVLFYSWKYFPILSLLTSNLRNGYLWSELSMASCDPSSFV